MQEGQIEPDNSIGRFLADTMASVPRISADAFDKLFNDSVQVGCHAILHSQRNMKIDTTNAVLTYIVVCVCVQDLLLVLYLANLTKTQLTLAEKLNTAAQIV